MEKEVLFTPAFDKRDPDPKKNYGIHGVDMRFVLKGNRGAVQFLVFTNWQLPEVQQEMYRKAANERNINYLRVLLAPTPADLGYHSLKPHYEGQEVMSDSCEFLDGKPCYYDGSGLNAERIMEVLVREGGAGVWRELESYYTELFGELE